MSRYKKFRSRKSFNRKVGNRGAPRERILIICEGEQTEPNYFRSFRVSSAVFIAVRGIGANTESLVRRAIIERDAVIGTHESYDQIWCVFDRNSFPSQNFNSAIHLAENEGIRVAYSNEAFELWYLLHFGYLQSGLTRVQYVDRLANSLGHPYQKNSISMYEELINLQDTAIRNAERLINSYQNNDALRNNPSTTVHLLVKELNKYSI